MTSVSAVVPVGPSVGPSGSPSSESFSHCLRCELSILGHSASPSLDISSSSGLKEPPSKRDMESERKSLTSGIDLGVPAAATDAPEDSTPGVPFAGPGVAAAGRGVAGVAAAGLGVAGVPGRVPGVPGKTDSVGLKGASALRAMKEFAVPGAALRLGGNAPNAVGVGGTEVGVCGIMTNWVSTWSRIASEFGVALLPMAEPGMGPDAPPGVFPAAVVGVPAPIGKRLRDDIPDAGVAPV